MTAAAIQITSLETRRWTDRLPPSRTSLRWVPPGPPLLPEGGPVPTCPVVPPAKHHVAEVSLDVVLS